MTHFLTGACLARAGLNRRTAYATLAMTLAAEAPDIDVGWGLGGPVTGFAHHRGITHTLAGAPVMALLVTGVVWALARLLPKPVLPVRWVWVWVLALIADASHLFLDWTNTYGLRPFYPWDPHWYAGSFVFIFDPLIFAFLLLGLGLPGIFGLVESEMRRRGPGELRGRGMAIAALAMVGVLWGVRAVEHGKAERLMASACPSLPRRVAAEPSIVDPFTWHGLADQGAAYRTAGVDSRTGQVERARTVEKPPATRAVIAAKKSYLGRIYGDWSSWPLVEDLDSSVPPGSGGLPSGAKGVRFSDLRFDLEAPGPLGGDRSDVLSGWVVVGSGGKVLEEWMNGRSQR